MLEFLDRLREKPEAYRVRVAVITAAAITGTIALLWLATLDISGDAKRVVEEERSRDDVQTPLSTIFGGLSDAFSEGRRQLDDIRNLFETAPRGNDESL